MQIRPFLPDDAPCPPRRLPFLRPPARPPALHHRAVASLSAIGIRRRAVGQAFARQPPMGGRGGRLHCIEGFADLQPASYIDPFFVAGERAGRGVAGR